MTIQVETRDCTALTEAELGEMASISGSFDVEGLAFAKERWVLCTSARIDGELRGFAFSTLERIGGTPCVLLGLISVRRDDDRDDVLSGLMNEEYHRALMAFPDEDVVVGSRFVRPDGLEVFAELTDIIPRPEHRAVGEERAWGRRLAKRFAVDGHYDEKSFVVATGGQSGYIDHESSNPTSIDPDVAALFTGVDAAAGGAIIVYGWTMAEDLLKLGSR